MEVAGRSDEPDVRGRGTPHGEISRQWLDSSAIREQLGWTPAWDLRRGLEATYEWYVRELPRLPTLSMGGAGSPHETPHPRHRSLQRLSGPRL